MIATIRRNGGLDGVNQRRVMTGDHVKGMFGWDEAIAFLVPLEERSTAVLQADSR